MKQTFEPAKDQWIMRFRWSRVEQFDASARRKTRNIRRIQEMKKSEKPSTASVSSAEADHVGKPAAMTHDKATEPDTSDHGLGAKGTISQAGRSGGRLPRDIGTQDELKRSNERPAGKTRVNKSDEKEGRSE